MIVAIYTDDGAVNGCGQDIISTAPREEAKIFSDYEAFRRADNSLLREKTRLNPRFIKWYEVRDATISRATVAALIEVAKVAKDAPAYLDWLTKMLRDANEHPEQIWAAETLAANLRYTIAAAEGVRNDGQ